jgi:hypothetical protein
MRFMFPHRFAIIFCATDLLVSRYHCASEPSNLLYRPEVWVVTTKRKKKQVPLEPVTPFLILRL